MVFIILIVELNVHMLSFIIFRSIGKVVSISYFHLVCPCVCLCVCVCFFENNNNNSNKVLCHAKNFTETCSNLFFSTTSQPACVREYFRVLRAWSVIACVREFVQVRVRACVRVWVFTPGSSMPDHAPFGLCFRILTTDI